MLLLEYLKKLEEIRTTEFLSMTELVRDLNISYITLMRLRKFPETCSMKTMRKIKKYVDAYESKNMSVIH
jgi:hypothetical protein